MEVKEAEESTISHKQVNIQFWIWMNRNQEVLNMKNEKGLKKKNIRMERGNSCLQVPGSKSQSEFSKVYL